MGDSRKIRIAEHIEIEWLAERFAPAACPNCGAEGPARQVLDIDYRPPDAAHRFILQICPHCTARFVDNPEAMDYSTDELIEIGWNIYQVQLGAGVWPISAPLTRVKKPAAARVLEIGGAYGFGLDFCVRARGWQGIGFDPSPLAAFGARELGLDIRQDYFAAKDLALGPWDVAISTEVVEHLAHPPAFFALMRAALADDGVLVLTTPDAEWITPGLGAGQMMPLLSPGAHLVLQTAESLRLALGNAGFAHVVVRRGAMSLVAYASAAPFELDEDAAAGRAMYRRYLVERSRTSGVTSDLRLGFAGRGLFEAANDGDAAAAEAAWAALLPAAQERFGIDLASINALPPGAADANLAELAQLMPLGLGMLLFGRVMHLLGTEADRAGLLVPLRVAGAAVAALQNALAKRSLTDGLSANIGEIIKDEILLSLAEAGDDGQIDALMARADAVVGWRAFIAYVNADALAAAAKIRAALLDDMPGLDLPGGLRRNALLSLANFALAPGGETALAFRCAEALRELGENADAIILQGYTRLVNASRYAEAQRAAADYEIDRLAAQWADEKVGRDAKLAQMVLDLAAGDPAEIPARLRTVTLEPERRDVMLLEAFIRLVNASRYEEALGFIRDHDVPALAVRVGGEVARNAGLARMVLDLAVGDPAEIPARLAGLDLPAGRAEILLVHAFMRLASAARFEEAVRFREQYGVAGLVRAHAPEVGPDGAIALAVTDLAVGDPAMAPARLEGMDIAAGRRTELLLAAFTGLVNAGRYEEAEGLAAREPCFGALEHLPGKAAEDARLAAVLLDLHAGRTERAVEGMQALARAGLDAELLDPMLVDGFVRLVNTGKFSPARELNQARAIERRLEHCATALRLDALAALLMIELQRRDNANLILQRLEQAREGGLDEERFNALTLTAFVTLVNEADFASARLLLHLASPLLIKLRPPLGETACNALFAAGILFLQERDDWRRSATSFARLRDALVKRMPAGTEPDPLFWPALRGEVLALHRLNRGADATALLTDLIDAYPGAPEDLRKQIEGAPP